VQIKDGDWVIERGRFGGFECRQVIKVSKAVIFCSQVPYGGHRRIRIDEVLYSGDEATAKKMLERLVSSKSLYDDECRRSYQRRSKRDAEILGIAK